MPSFALLRPSSFCRSGIGSEKKKVDNKKRYGDDTTNVFISLANLK
jgi:hypothetical protein